MLAVGRLKAGPERELCERYLERVRAIGPRLGLRVLHRPGVAESRAARSEDRIAEEAAALLAAARRQGPAHLPGRSAENRPTALAFAEMLARDAAASVARMVFADRRRRMGWRARWSVVPSRTISFGRMTWPHQLVSSYACRAALPGDHHPFRPPLPSGIMLRLCSR